MNRSWRRLKADGTFSEGEKAAVPRLRDDGSYSWGIYYEGEPDAYGVRLWPVGVEITLRNEIIPSDTAKVRLTSGQDEDSLYRAAHFYPD